ncbi:MAG: hypothetical protein L0H25_06520, partial [Micrococcales bacterium]|nr:hypothetical protein [Micrococcales bacterium]
MSNEHNTSNQHDHPSEHSRHSEDPTMNVRATSDPTRPFRVEPAAPVPDDAVSPDVPQAESLPQQERADVTPSGPTHPAPASWQGGPALVTVRKGPRPATILLGLLSILVAAFAFVHNLTDARID